MKRINERVGLPPLGRTDGSITAGGESWALTKVSLIVYLHLIKSHRFVKLMQGSDNSGLMLTPQHAID